MLEELKAVAVMVVVVMLFCLAVVGVVMLSVATGDAAIINHCKDQGWHNFGQTRIICSVELKKEAK